MSPPFYSRARAHGLGSCDLHDAEQFTLTPYEMGIIIIPGFRCGNRLGEALGFSHIMSLLPSVHLSLWPMGSGSSTGLSR